LDTLAEALLQDETIDRDQLTKILGSHVELLQKETVPQMEAARA
jgi:hypothetical protein